MKILAAETATSVVSVALAESEVLLGECTFNAANRHTALLIPLIDDLLRFAGVSLHEVEAFVVGRGPGSFTGVRIGVSTLKSMSYALQKPLVGVCTLDALAWALQDARMPVCAMFDARRDEVYAAIYEEPPRRSSEILCLPVERLVERFSGPTLVVGEGALKYRERLEACAGDNVRWAASDAHVPRAGALISLALPRLRQGQADDFMAITPIYARKPEAQVQFETGRLGRKTLI